MRYVLLFWALPVGTFWGWYFLSLNDINFGFLFLSRDVHDFAFRIYGELLGIDPAAIPGMVADACLFDFGPNPVAFRVPPAPADQGAARPLLAGAGGRAELISAGRARPEG